MSSLIPKDDLIHMGYTMISKPSLLIRTASPVLDTSLIKGPPFLDLRKAVG
jgi:hypothetical protein